MSDEYFNRLVVSALRAKRVDAERALTTTRESLRVAVEALEEIGTRLAISTDEECRDCLWCGGDLLDDDGHVSQCPTPIARRALTRIREAGREGASAGPKDPLKDSEFDSRFAADVPKEGR